MVSRENDTELFIQNTFVLVRNIFSHPFLYLLLNTYRMYVHIFRCPSKYSYAFPGIYFDLLLLQAFQKIEKKT